MKKWILIILVSLLPFIMGFRFLDLDPMAGVSGNYSNSYSNLTSVYEIGYNANINLRIKPLNIFLFESSFFKHLQRNISTDVLFSYYLLENSVNDCKFWGLNGFFVPMYSFPIYKNIKALAGAGIGFMYADNYVDRVTYMTFINRMGFSFNIWMLNFECGYQVNYIQDIDKYKYFSGPFVGVNYYFSSISVKKEIKQYPDYTLKIVDKGRSKFDIIITDFEKRWPISDYCLRCLEPASIVERIYKLNENNKYIESFQFTEKGEKTIICQLTKDDEYVGKHKKITFYNTGNRIEITNISLNNTSLLETNELRIVDKGVDNQIIIKIDDIYSYLNDFGYRLSWKTENSWQLLGNGSFDVSNVIDLPEACTQDQSNCTRKYKLAINYQHNREITIEERMFTVLFYK